MKWKERRKISKDACCQKRIPGYNETVWESEDMPFGGVCIYLDRPNYSPFVTIRRIIGEDGDPEKYLDEYQVF